MTRYPLVMPEVSDADVSWVCGILGLPATAFSGADGNDPRLAVIRSSDSHDIEACPGSGKTTLLVAKLAILARHWTERCRGICVLSHTNVARREIEQKLGTTLVGKRLLSYPHFVGTIHGFVNEFLGVPWVRSMPLPISMIDDDICLKRRWYTLPINIRRGLESNRHDQNVLRVNATDFSVNGMRWGRNGTLTSTTETYKAIQIACRASCEDGLFCHGEMFLWAFELLDRVPQMREALRGRFPLLFVDEVQDNSEEQSALLFRIFMEGADPVIRQRFGDSNQAIYQHSIQGAGVTPDPFPNTTLLMTISNSHRFGQQIADFANPIAISPHGLIGLGPGTARITSDAGGKHTVFVFESLTVGFIMPCYASYLCELFSDRELRVGTFTAVGAVHRPAENDKIPRSVSHYWPSYDHELSVSEPRPGTFLQYLAVGKGLKRASGEAYPLVEKIAEGILRLAGILNPRASIANHKRKNRYVRELLSQNAEMEQIYLETLSFLISDEINIDPTDWQQKWAPQITVIANTIAGTSEKAEGATEFLAHTPGDAQQSEASPRDNVFRYPAETPRVQIRVGSIHSVKGETHVATLVLDTFFHNHHLATLKPWLVGDKSGGASESARNISRLRQHYVAMTRPSHLLCLAMREDNLSAVDISALKERGWRVARVSSGGALWI